MVVMTDFVWGMHDTVDPANKDDMEMPNTNYYGEKLVQA